MRYNGTTNLSCLPWVQSRCNTHVAKRRIHKLMKRHWLTPSGVWITDKLRSYGEVFWSHGAYVENWQHKALNNWAENSHLPTRAQKRSCDDPALQGTCNAFVSPANA